MAPTRAGFPILLFLLALALSGCGRDGQGPSEPPGEEGIAFTDSSIVLDFYGFSSAGCAEVLPASFANADSVPAGTAAFVHVRTVACYAADVEVVDTAGTHVRTLKQFMVIHGRRDGDKDRGVDSWLTWDGKDGMGAAVPKGKYRWRIRFSLGGGRELKYHGPVWLE